MLTLVFPVCFFLELLQWQETVIEHVAERSGVLGKAHCSYWKGLCGMALTGHPPWAHDLGLVDAGFPPGASTRAGMQGAPPPPTMRQH